MLLQSYAGQPHGYMLPAVSDGHPLVYISNTSLGRVDVYPAQGQHSIPIGSIGGLENPAGLAVDKNRDLWVYDNGPTPEILAFHRGAFLPYRSLRADPGVGLAVDAAENIYAATLSNAVNVYAAGSDVPTKKLVDRKLDQLWSVAVDRKGNVFCNGIEYVSSLPAVYAVDEFRAHSPKRSRVRRLIFLGYWGGLAVTVDDDLVVQAVNAADISVYQPPYTGSPVWSISYDGYLGSSTAIALTASGKSVWLANNVTQRRSEGEKLDLISGDVTATTSSKGLAYPMEGIAVDPPAAF